MKATHTPTGLGCDVVIRTDERCFCNFMGRPNPFTWVVTDELHFGDTLPPSEDLVPALEEVLWALQRPTDFTAEELARAIEDGKAALASQARGDGLTPVKARVFYALSQAYLYPPTEDTRSQFENVLEELSKLDVITNSEFDELAKLVVHPFDSKPKSRWENDSIQFPRLIAELEAVGAFDGVVMEDLREATDLTNREIGQLVSRAQAAWDRIKAELP
jgi:hypothetical protein